METEISIKEIIDFIKDKLRNATCELCNSDGFYLVDADLNAIAIKLYPGADITKLGSIEYTITTFPVICSGCGNVKLIAKSHILNALNSR